MKTTRTTAFPECTPARQTLLGALLAGATLLSGLAPLPALAALQDLRFTNHGDGTPDFNDGDGPGLDSGPDNRIVRTNDSFEYTAAFSSEPSDRNVRIVVTLPPATAGTTAHSRWSFIPPECRKDVSSLSADAQTLICVLPDLPAAATRSVYFRAEVLGTTRHGTVLAPPTISMSSSQTPGITPSTTPEPLRVSAAPFYDVQILPVAQNRAALSEASGPNGEDGFYHRFNVGLMARNPHNSAQKQFGKKGIEMLDPTQPIDIDLDISQLPASVRLDDWRTPGAASDRLAVTGSFGDGCGSPNEGRPSSLSGFTLSTYARVQDAGPNQASPRWPNYHHAVSKGGDCAVQSHDRERIRIRLTGTDTSLAHTPTIFHGSNARIPPGEFWVASKGVILWTDLASYPLNQKVWHPMRFAGYQAQSISGQPITGNDPANDTATYDLTNTPSGDVVKIFQPDASLPAPWRTVRDQTITSGNAVNQMAAGQTVAGYVGYSNRGTVPHRNIALCEIIDRTAFDIGSNFGVSLAGNHAAGATIRYGAHKNGSPYFASTDAAPAEQEGRTTAERSVTGRSAYSTVRCNDTGIDWFETPEQAEAAGGLVYVRVSQPTLPANKDLTMSVRGLILRSTWAATIEVQAPQAATRVAGTPIPNDTIIRNRADILSDTIPDLYLRNQMRDHLRVISAQTSARILKEVIEPATAAQGVPVAAGTTLRYRLTPRYSTHLPPMPGTVTVTDVLPQGLRYVPGAATVGGQAQEPQVQADTPAPGLTTLTWRFAGRKPHLGGVAEAGAAMPAIVYRARASRSLTDGVVIRNQASISGGAFDIEADCVYDPAGNGYGNCPKAARVDVPVQTPPGFVLEKSASRAHIEPGDPFDYTVSFVAIGQELRPPEIPDVIDILPFVGDGVDNPAMHFSARSPASHFEPGAYQLHGVHPPSADAEAKVYYTRRPPREIHADPQDASNRIPGGSTRWCQQHELGTAGCPAHIGASTAIRVHPGITMLRPGHPYDIGITLRSDPVLAWPGSVFANRASSRPADPAAQLLFVESQSDLQVQVSMAMSSLSGRVFVDLDQDNRFEAGDQALPEQCISIAGTNVKQQKLVFSMRTGADGRYAFVEGAANRVYRGADCSGTPLRHFLGLMKGEYVLTRQPAGGTPLPGTHPGAIHAGSSGGTPGTARIDAILLDTATQAVDYHFTDAPTLPRLTLSAHVNNRHGGTAQVGDVSLLAHPHGAPATATPVLEGISGSPGVSQVAVPAGRYEPGHAALPGYRASDWQCTVNDRPVAAEALSLNHGDKAHCQIVFEDLPGRLTLLKRLDIRHGRPGKAEDFVLHAEGQGNGLPTLAGVTGAASVTAAEVPAGAYALREDNRTGFLPGPWMCSLTRADGSETDAVMDGAVVQVGNGEHARCAITNTDAPLRVELVQVTTNEDSSPARGSDVRLFVTPVGKPGQRIPLKQGEAASTQLVPGDEYELSVSQTPGYETKLFCRDASQRAVPLRLVLGAQNIACQVVRKRIPTEAAVTKTLLRMPEQVAGSVNEYELAYEVTVRHEGGAAGHYDLLDVPAFDPDVEIVSSRASLDDTALPASAQSAGQWTLASQRALAMNDSHRYRLHYRVRVRFGGRTDDDACQAGMAGRGLFNQVRMSVRHDVDDDGSGPTTSAVQQAQACAETPVPLESATLSIEKTGSLRQAEIGDQISYRLRIRNHGNGPARNPVVLDRLPAGFRLVPGSVRVQGARQTAFSQQGQVLQLTLDQVPAQGTAGAGQSTVQAQGSASTGEVVVSYRLRIGVGSLEGDGINRAHIECRPAGSRQPARCSNESRWKVEVRAGIFSEHACLTGQIFVDCNGNSVKDGEELGIPGVRLYLENGTWLVSDEHGKYSHCGLRPRTHVLKLDGRTLPRRSRLVTSSAQNSGDAHSLFIDARKGMLHRADFIEGSCSATVIEQVKARQAQGARASVQTEAGQPALTFESKRGAAARPRQQGTDASQPMSHTRH